MTYARVSWAEVEYGLPATGSLGVTLGEVGLSAVSAVEIAATAALQLDAMLLDGAGAVDIVGSAAVTLGPVLLDALVGAISPATGDVAIMLDPVGLLAEAEALVQVVGALQLTSVALAAEVTVPISGAADIGLGPLGLAFAAELPITGAASISLGPLTVSATIGSVFAIEGVPSIPGRPSAALIFGSPASITIPGRGRII